MDKNWKEQLASRLRLARGRRSQAEISQESGVTTKTISMIELAKAGNIRPTTIAKLAVATGEHPNDWLAIMDVTLPQENVRRLQMSIRTRQPHRRDHNDEICMTRGRFRDIVGAIVEGIAEGAGREKDRFGIDPLQLKHIAMDYAFNLDG